MMAKSREHVESFLEELREQLTAGVTSPGATTEACMSQQHRPIPENVTLEEQKRVLFHTGQEVTSQSKDSVYHILTQEEKELSADLEQRHNSSNIKQLEEKSTQVNMKTNWETIQRKRPLTFQLMDEIEQHWERERNEIRCLKTKTEQQQKDIDRLTAEKHNQYLVIKAPGVKVIDVIEKPQKNKNEATQEKMQPLTLQAEIYQERTTLDRRHNEIINEQCKFEMIKFDRSKFESKEVQEIMDSLLSAMNKNKKIMLTAKQAKQQIEKNLEDVKEELDRNKKDISQQRDQIEQIKHSLSININKVKQRWIEFQRDTEIQRVTVPETGRRDGKQEGTDTSQSVKEKLSRIRQEIEKVWDVLEDSQQQLDVTVREKREVHTQSIQMENVKSNSQQLRQDTDTHMKVTHCETLIKTDIQRQKQDIENNLRQIQWEKHEIERINTRIQAERKNIERERQSAKAEMDALKCMRESNERQRQELDDKLQRTKREIRELEVMNSEIEIKKKDLLKTIRMSRRKKQISEMKKKTEHATQDLEDGQNVMVGHRSEQGLEVNMEKTLNQNIQQVDVMKHKGNQVEDIGDNMEMSTKNNEKGMEGMIFEVQETKKMLRMMREDTKKGKKIFTEEIIWRNFQEKKKRRKMDQWLEKILKERDELEIIKLQIQGQREEVQRKLQDTITTILAMGEMKANIEKAVTEITNIQLEMLKTQRQMEKDKENVRKYMRIHDRRSQMLEFSCEVMPAPCGKSGRHLLQLYWIWLQRRLTLKLQKCFVVRHFRHPSIGIVRRLQCTPWGLKFSLEQQVAELKVNSQVNTTKPYLGDNRPSSGDVLVTQKNGSPESNNQPVIPSSLLVPEGTQETEIGESWQSDTTRQATVTDAFGVMWNDDPIQEDYQQAQKVENYIFGLIQRRVLPMRPSKPRTSLSHDARVVNVVRQSSLCRKEEQDSLKQVSVQQISTLSQCSEGAASQACQNVDQKCHLGTEFNEEASPFYHNHLLQSVPYQPGFYHKPRQASMVHTSSSTLPDYLSCSVQPAKQDSSNSETDSTLIHNYQPAPAVSKSHYPPSPDGQLVNAEYIPAQPCRAYTRAYAQYHSNPQKGSGILKPSRSMFSPEGNHHHEEQQPTASQVQPSRCRGGPKKCRLNEERSGATKRLGKKACRSQSENSLQRAPERKYNTVERDGGESGSGGRGSRNSQSRSKKQQQGSGSCRRWQSSLELSQDEADQLPVPAHVANQREPCPRRTRKSRTHASYVSPHRNHNLLQHSHHHQPMEYQLERDQVPLCKPSENYLHQDQGESESSMSEADSPDSSSLSSDSDESGGLVWPQQLPPQLSLPSPPAPPGAPMQPKAFVKIKASHALKKKILRFRTGSLKVMTTV
ncbi:uncharacterized protein LOC128456600 isoform X2 [Pleuronectes platessa]|uniref:uncharacterized protein LOC128456600 isoform X2 n=1 Tax=Pleuronectes platessa TaxID=8262 RepID=UPI00232A0CC2|nr:uncharacterized protein LOC128456600 isoform X2 [Pleuronectes platessa]